ncbi:MFS transporter [Streptomyces sp. WG-D5]
MTSSSSPSALTESAVAAADTPSARPMEARTVVSGALGSALEYFDFAIYGVLSATIFPELFFHGLGATGGILASFATFGVGVAARPLGALFFGHLGDRRGRKPVLFTTLGLMGASSILIGLLPTGQGVGIAALLVALRFLQGFSIGGEATGSQILAVEHCDSRRRGLMGALVMVGSPLSQLLANLALVVLTAVLTEEQFTSWGWRVPFLGSIVMVAIAVFIRTKLDESPAFTAQHETAPATSGERRGAGLRVLASHPRQVAGLTLAWAGTTLSFFLVVVYGLDYLPSATGMSTQSVTVVLMVANGLSACFTVIGGRVCDRIGRRRVFYYGLAGCFLGTVLFFTATGSNPVINGLFVALVLCSIQFLGGAQPALFAEQFPTEVRFSGMALSFTLANVLFAAPAPFIAAALTAVGGTPLVMGVNLAVLAVSAIAVTTLREGRGLDLTSLDPISSESPRKDASA